MSVFHEGERMVQKRIGVQATADLMGRMIQSVIPQGFDVFLEEQSIVVIASTDAACSLWASLITGYPGMIQVKDPKTIEIHTQFVLQDPFISNIKHNGNVGLIVIDFEHQIRIRINGKAKFTDENALRVDVEQVYGNCPKHIQMRSLTPSDRRLGPLQTSGRQAKLTPEQAQWIRDADTFFIASSGPEGKTDASHRGGNPGFIQVLGNDTLVFPDYRGNMQFNTLGNIQINPHTGILFIDFHMGRTLQLTGRSTIVWDIWEEEKLRFPGAQRLVEFRMDGVIQTEHVIPFDWNLLGYSPYNPR
ncbi:pyridoxamine 5'-phosphate oxidase family protein [Paenibacillus sp. ISL-20]|uniref:pyridoxamine 5'-phosphate oxidase family protein n=1 Tax=Paenibacillus sp. ISL-20 TaxID=2819163 RepID=UPI001BE611F4|nr:pyridoxamine 5'-phosphate oxidase family protein [Paenibacillus sp. ISL-20]MBT2761344.1 pyridoxamine 5'-phosphate oxidase family protein [Paenibacillus sp. ISL-20]